MVLLVVCEGDMAALSGCCFTEALVSLRFEYSAVPSASLGVRHAHVTRYSKLIVFRNSEEHVPWMPLHISVFLSVQLFQEAVLLSSLNKNMGISSGKVTPRPWRTGLVLRSSYLSTHTGCISLVL